MDSGIVDLRGRKVSDLKITGSALVKAQQWVSFLDDHAKVISEREPWVQFLVRAVVNFHQAFIIMSRRLRKNECWVGGMTMGEATIGLVSDASERLAWFEKGSEQVDQRGLPEWARFMFASIQGGLRMQVRLAGECEQIIRKGHLLVNVSPRVDTIEKARELGEEVEV